MTRKTSGGARFTACLNSDCVRHCVRLSVCLRVWGVCVCTVGTEVEFTGPDGGFLATRVAQSEFADVMMKSACFEENELFLHFTSFKC